MTGSLEDTIATVLARIRDQFPGDIVYTEATHGSMLHALLDEEGPEALVEAVLSAAGVVPAEPATHDTWEQVGWYTPSMADGPNIGSLLDGKFDDNDEPVYRRVAGVGGEAPAT